MTAEVHPELFFEAYKQTADRFGIGEIVRLLFRYRELTGCTIEECAELYCQLDSLDWFREKLYTAVDEVPYWWEPWETDIWDYRMYKGRRLRYFATRLSRILKRWWREGRRDIPGWRFICPWNREWWYELRYSPHPDRISRRGRKGGERGGNARAEEKGR